MRADQVLKDLSDKKEKKEDKKKSYSRSSEWPKCCKPGCPLWATIKADVPTCLYHHRAHGLEADALTESIKVHVKYLEKYKEMQRWTTKQWREKRSQIMGWPVLPATELEMKNPTLYLQRLYKWIEQSIKERAEEIYQGK